jgi:hypothetical protein
MYHAYGVGNGVIASYVPSQTHIPFYHVKLNSLMINVKHAKKLVLTIAVALVMATAGWFIQETYSWPQPKSVDINSESFSLEANQTTYRSVNLPQAGQYSLRVSIPKNSGTVFAQTITNQSLQQWLNGNYNVSWSGTQREDAHSVYSVYYGQVVNCTSDVANVVFWNPEKITLQVTFSASLDWFEIDHVKYYSGIALLAAGSLILLAVLGIWTIKNRTSLVNSKWTGRKLFTLIIAVVLLGAGLWAANVFSQPVQSRETTSKGIVPLAAHGQHCVVYQETQPSTYYVAVDGGLGFIEVYVNTENRTAGYWPNGTTEAMTPMFNDTKGQFSYSMWVGPDQSITRYLVFYNPDATSKQVTYEVTRDITYSNYIALTAGIAAAAAGALLFGLTLLQDKLRNFNKALENQE